MVDYFMLNNNVVNQQLSACLEILTNVLGADLLGVYLYGSYLVGGLQKYSDIDLFVITNRSTTTEEKIELTNHLLQISGIYMKSTKPPIEMTFVEKAAVNPWHYPPLFDFQYGEWLRESFEMGNFEPWQSREMPDLALIITQILLKSHTLWGEEPEQLLVPVPYQDFIKAMLNDVDRLAADLEEDTRNVLLTIARIWSTIETNMIRSKPDAADWVIERLPSKYRPVMKRAKSICTGNEEEHWDDLDGFVKTCADFMLSRINERKLSINVKAPSNQIKLA
ncbi:aminoglycoside adenylyltransferase family protein [Legionella impletisoli]|uniref:Aminoglycoside (3'') (9) adenylyltransferase n=1 Tax=Legionella impletisoli TaxID=343510 RepID=A0A917NC79_9GAMM|nr:aminoglycoside adenylyltransferase family protein [Legionella impletisoli]GGI87776.1 nucleotidyltransferase [Legionella impletisoli]